MMLKCIPTLVLTLFTAACFGQQMSTDDWKEQSKTNIRLLPKYGHHPKTDKQKEMDEEFINSTMSQEQFKGDRKAASNHLMELGFTYLYRGDAKTAMYRYNQAYLLDSANTEVYWGYGAFFMTIGNYSEAAEQYKEGLSIDPENTHLLTDYGTYFMAQYYGMKPVDEKAVRSQLDSAITYLVSSYGYDSTDMNTAYKLSICYWLKGECDSAWRYYDACKALGGKPITEDYTKDLKKSCKRKK